MIRVGVTGGIGSGKTTFCKKWEDLGAFVLYADDFAKDLMVTNNNLITSIKKVFGNQSYSENGELNRGFLAQEAFEKGRVEELNGIVHPILWKKIDEVAEEKEKAGIKIFVKEAALLLQNGRPENIDYVILLLADENERINRTVKRDITNPEKIRDRINKQQDFKSLTHLADYIVENDGSREELMDKAESIFDIIKS